MALTDSRLGRWLDRHVDRIVMVVGGAGGGATIAAVFSLYAVVKFIVNLGQIEGQGVAHLGTIVAGYMVGGVAGGAIGGVLYPFLHRSLAGQLLISVTGCFVFVLGIAAADNGFNLARVDFVEVSVIGGGLGLVGGLVWWNEERRAKKLERGSKEIAG